MKWVKVNLSTHVRGYEFPFSKSFFGNKFYCERNMFSCDRTSIIFLLCWRKTCVTKNWNRTIHIKHSMTWQNVDDHYISVDFAEFFQNFLSIFNIFVEVWPKMGWNCNFSIFLIMFLHIVWKFARMIAILVLILHNFYGLFFLQGLTKDGQKL